jgi:hypothetical protein
MRLKNNSVYPSAAASNKCKNSNTMKNLLIFVSISVAAPEETAELFYTVVSKSGKGKITPPQTPTYGFSLELEDDLTVSSNCY